MLGPPLGHTLGSQGGVDLMMHGAVAFARVAVASNVILAQMCLSGVFSENSALSGVFLGDLALSGSHQSDRAFGAGFLSELILAGEFRDNQTALGSIKEC